MNVSSYEVMELCSCGVVDVCNCIYVELWIRGCAELCMYVVVGV